MMALDSTMPRVVAEWFFARGREHAKQYPFGDFSYEFAGVTSFAALQALEPAKAAALWLEAQDPRNEMRRQIARLKCVDRGRDTLQALSRFELRTLGAMVVDDTTAFVLQHEWFGRQTDDPFFAHLPRPVQVRKTTIGWRIVPHPQLLRGDVTFSIVDCERVPPPLPSDPAVPSFLLGEFEDDYANRHSISKTAWLQGTRARYHIREWHTAEQFLIAQNDSANPGQGGRWTRIDWMRLEGEGMAPYAWAFCFSAYDALTRDQAAATTIARRETPRTGCNGHPFSRMRRREQ